MYYKVTRVSDTDVWYLLFYFVLNDHIVLPVGVCSGPEPRKREGQGRRIFEKYVCVRRLSGSSRTSF